MRSLRRRMAWSAIATAAAALLVVLLGVGPGLRRETLVDLQEALAAEARLMARVVEDALARGASPAELDPVVDEAARDARARVTIIAPDGRVLADSAASGAALMALENHGRRPEVVAAIAEGFGSSVRRSTTVHEALLYVAVPVRHLGRLAGVARVAMPLTRVEERVFDLRRAVMLALLLAFLLTAGLSALLARPLAGPLEEIMAGAREFAAGNLSARIGVRRSDELGELAKILNQSAAQLQEKLAENARERARRDAVLAAMEDGVLGVDHKGSVILANDALRRSLDLGEPTGRHYLEVIRQTEVSEVIEHVLETGERSAVEVEILKLKKAFALSAVPFPAGAGVPPGAVLTFHDATERRRLDRVRRDFVANASHELRTPLTSIRGFVEALEDGALGEPERGTRFLGKIRTHADRMAALVENLLELSRLESGEHPPRFEQLLPGELVEDVVASFGALASRKQVTLQRIPDELPSVSTDADRLRRILESLVDNALKYTSAGGRVEVEARAAASGAAVFEVRDNGPGIAPEHLPRIFERFYRVDRARSRELGGTGLGLAIVKHLAESVGASVEVASQLGAGTTFRVHLPPGQAPGGAAPDP